MLDIAEGIRFTAHEGYDFNSSELEVISEIMDKLGLSVSEVLMRHVRGDENCSKI
jgi:hypothetical protein